MKVVFVLFDSLIRKALASYGGTEIDTPNFDRLAKRGISLIPTTLVVYPACLPVGIYTRVV
jgi:hypothetical protein